ncbi:putative phiE125 gp8 family phage protein [Laceyella sacchari]|uniref:head-tail connector protein n=1 Tax=Laceyella sacchari TaxID=37482 RepID=UPI000ADD8729|nr:head-tail connector protein [Laceyella sacchari]TCW35302.1 putative phiE125 gp8 family phage protein [Laceyella sacchari]
MAISPYALTTLANAKEYLQITDTSQDARLEILINGTTIAIENYIKRKVKERTFTDEAYDGNGTDLLFLKNKPVSSIASVKYVGNGITDILEMDNYRVDAHGRLYNASGWVRGFQNYLVTYTAGYSTIPDDIQLACLKWVEYLYKTDIASYSSAFDQAGNSTQSPHWIPTVIKELLSPYKRVVIL